MANAVNMNVADNFLGYHPSEIDPVTARAVLVPAPYDGTASYRKGASDGPQAIIQASQQMEDFDLELLADPSQLGIYTAPPVVPPVPNTEGPVGPEAMTDAVEQAVSQWSRPGVLVGVLGGEHSVTVGAVRAIAAKHEGLSVLYLDAHADMRDEYQGSRYSHACVARRLVENCPLVEVGIRSAEAEEWDWLTRNRVPVVSWPPADGSDYVTEVLAQLGDPVYVSIDLDVLDPSIMSAVGTPEPGGMGWYELLRLLRAVAANRTIVGFDVVELAPDEGPEACAYTAAKLVYKLIGYVLTEPSSQFGSGQRVQPGDPGTSGRKDQT
jgi:agmatinase